MQLTLRYPGFWLAVGLVAIVCAGQTILSVPLELIDLVLREKGGTPLRLLREPAVLGILNLIAIGIAVGVGLLVNRLSPGRAFPFGSVSRKAWGAVILTGLGAGILL